MRILTAILLTIGSILIFRTGFSKPWRGIVPLHSNCEDVKRLLGSATCKADMFDLDNETVFISYSEQTCDERDEVRWNVPPGTVMRIDVSPKIKPKFSDVGGDLTRYKKERDEHLPEVIYYTDEEAGLTLMVHPNGYVGRFFYGPAAKDSNLRCHEYPPDQDPKIDYHGSKFDEFVTNSAIDDVKARLDGFYDKGLKTKPDSTAYVILYRGKCRTSRYTLRATKNYLMLRRLPARRIKLLYGGYRDEPTMELWVVPKGAQWPRPTPTYRSKGRWRC